MNDKKFEQGLKIRREVLGDTYVDNAINNADDFNMPLQKLITEYCWGEIWCNDDLTKQQRSMINLAMISALNCPHELKLHVKGALRNGLSKETIRGVLMQVATYCGIPIAIDSFRVAKEAIEEYENEMK